MPRKRDYPDDLFAETRMSFGDHLDELRYRMIAAIKALLACLILSFVLDGIGSSMKLKYFGIGKPVLEIIKSPVERQMDAFFDERAWRAMEEQLGIPKNEEEEKNRELAKQKFLNECREQRTASSLNLNQPQPIEVNFQRTDLVHALESTDDVSTIRLSIRPIDLAITERIANERIGKRNQLTTLSAQEMFVVYFKVALLCGFILGCPIIFYQFWAFVGAGLYPHEKRYVYTYLPFSIGLFLAGIMLCFIWVLPGAVKALLAFNDWLGVDPDIRLNEWLSLAIILPLVFGLSFQTPLVMLFLNRIGMFSWHDYLSKWRHATFVLAFFSALITPTPDAVTMLYLFVPMMALYVVGILLCRWMPELHEQEEEEARQDHEVAV